MLLDYSNLDDERPEEDILYDMAGQGESRVPPVPPYTGPKEPPEKIQSKLDFKHGYFGLKINECDLVKHNVTILEIVKSFDFTHWVVGRDEALGKKGIAHYHIHFKSDKKIEALRKQKQKVMPQWGHTAKLYSPRKNADNWYCWAGYALKEMKVGMSEMTPDEIVEIDKHIHTQAVIKQSKLNYAQKEDDKKQEKKDLETRIYDKLDKSYLGKYEPGNIGDLAVLFGEIYFEEVGEMPPATTIKTKVWKWLYTRKIITMKTYVYYTTDFFSMNNL